MRPGTLCDVLLGQFAGRREAEEGGEGEQRRAEDDEHRLNQSADETYMPDA